MLDKNISVTKLDTLKISLKYGILKFNNYKNLVINNFIFDFRSTWIFFPLYNSIAFEQTNLNRTQDKRLKLCDEKYQKEKSCCYSIIKSTEYGERWGQSCSKL